MREELAISPPYLRRISQGAKFLSTALKQNKTLTALYLNYNNIGDLGLQHLLGALKNNTCAASVLPPCSSRRSRHTYTAHYKMYIY